MAKKESAKAKAATTEGASAAQEGKDGAVTRRAPRKKAKYGAKPEVVTYEGLHGQNVPCRL